MDDQFELFDVPKTGEVRPGPHLSVQAIAYVVELDWMLDRAGYSSRGRVDFIRSFLRLGCDSPFSNSLGLCREITKILNEYHAIPWHICEAVEKLRPAVRSEIIKRLQRLCS